MKIRELPRYEGVADNMGDFFKPADVLPDELLVRTGLMKSESAGIVECVMAHTKDASEWGWNLLVYAKYDGEWDAVTYMCPNSEVEEAVQKYLV